MTKLEEFELLVCDLSSTLKALGHEVKKYISNLEPNTLSWSELKSLADLNGKLRGAAFDAITMQTLALENAIAPVITRLQNRDTRSEIKRIVKFRTPIVTQTVSTKTIPTINPLGELAGKLSAEDMASLKDWLKGK